MDYEFCTGRVKIRRNVIKEEISDEVGSMKPSKKSLLQGLHAAEADNAIRA